MAELFGIVGTVAGLLQLTSEAIDVVGSVKHADEDRITLVAGLGCLKFLIEVLKHRLEDAKVEESWNRYVRLMQERSGTLEFDESSVTYKPPPEPKGPLAELYRTMEQISRKLNPPDAAQKSKHGRELRRKLFWKWKKSDYEHMLTNIARAQGQISFILDQDEYELLKNLKSDTTKIYRVTQGIKQSIDAEKDRREKQEQQEKDRREKHEKQEIGKWLSPLDFGEEKQKCESSFPSAKGVIKSFEFEQWSEGRPWQLVCYGKARSGKTVLSSIIAEHLKQNPKTPNTAVICLFFSWNDPQKKVLKHVLGSLLKQLIQQRPLSAELRDDWERATAEEAKPNLAQIDRHLKAQLQELDRVYVIMDAWDECEVELQYELQSSLEKLGAHKLSLFSTSRPVDDALPVGKRVVCSVCSEVDLKIYFHCSICDDGNFDVCWKCRQKTPACKDVSHELTEDYKEVFLDIDTPREVLEQYVRLELKRESGKGSKLYDKRLNSRGRGATRLGNCLQKEPDLSENIIRAAGEKAEGCFLHAKLFVDALKGMSSRKQIDTALESFPINLDDVYNDAIGRIQQMNESDRELGFKTLSVLACACRPLTLVELQEALAVMLRLSHEDEEEEELFYTKDDILKSTAGLIDINHHEDIVQLSHRSIRDSLVRNGVGGKHFRQAEVDIAMACLSYLSKNAFSERCSNAEEFEAKKAMYPLIAYTSQHWGQHVQKVLEDTQLQLKATAVRLLRDPHRVDAFMQALWFTDDNPWGWDVRKGVHGLHVCAKYGLYPLIPALVQKSDDINVEEEQYRQTPLMYACREGNFKTVQRLLDLDAAINLVSKRGLSALFEAISNGHLEVVNLLLTYCEREIDINAASEVQGLRLTRTALLLAVNLGHREIVSRLLEHPKIDVNQRDSEGCTALILAAITGQAEMARKFSKMRNIDVNAVDKYGRSALYFAADTGSTDIVEILLQNKADPDLPNSEGYTALMQAVCQERVESAKAILRSKPDLQCMNSHGCDVLHLTSEKDWPEVVRALVKAGAKVNGKDNDEQRPLHYAAARGHNDVVQILLEEGADRTMQDNLDRTPEDFAAAFGFMEVVKTLRGSEHVPAERAPPVWRLAREGRRDLLKSAIEARTLDLSETEPVTKNSALHCAVQHDQVAILTMLLRDGQMDPNCRNRDLCTPLSFAAERGDLTAVEELLKCHADPDLEDCYGNGPLDLACQQPGERVPIALVEGGAEINPEKVDIQDLFFRAVKLGNCIATEVLLQNGADVWEKDDLGKTAMQVAQGGGHTRLCQLLSSRTWSQKPEARANAEISQQDDSYQASSLAEKMAKDDMILPFHVVQDPAFDDGVPSSEVRRPQF